MNTRHPLVVLPLALMLLPWLPWATPALPAPAPDAGLPSAGSAAQPPALPSGAVRDHAEREARGGEELPRDLAFRTQFRQASTLTGDQGPAAATAWEFAGILHWSWLARATPACAQLRMQADRARFSLGGQVADHVTAVLVDQLALPVRVHFGTESEVSALEFDAAATAEGRNAWRAVVLNLCGRRRVGEWTSREPDLNGEVEVRATFDRIGDGFAATRSKLQFLDSRGVAVPVAALTSFGATRFDAAGDLRDGEYREAWHGRELVPGVVLAVDMWLRWERAEAPPLSVCPWSGDGRRHPPMGGQEVDSDGRERLQAMQVAEAHRVPVAARMQAIVDRVHAGQRRSAAMVQEFLGLARSVRHVPTALAEVARFIDAADPASAAVDVMLGAIGAAATPAAVTVLVERFVDVTRAPVLRAAAARALQQLPTMDVLEGPVLTVLAEPGLDGELHVASLLLLGAAVANSGGEVAARLWQRLSAYESTALAAGVHRAWQGAVANSHRTIGPEVAATPR